MHANEFTSDSFSIMRMAIISVELDAHNGQRAVMSVRGGIDCNVSTTI